MMEALRVAAFVPLPTFIVDDEKDEAYQQMYFRLFEAVMTLAEKRPISEEAVKLILSFNAAVNAQNLLRYCDDRQFIGGIQLIQAYSKDRALNKHLVPLLVEAGAEMLDVFGNPLIPHCAQKRDPEKARRKLLLRIREFRQKAFGVLLQLHKTGIKVPGFVVSKNHGKTYFEIMRE
jgi:hypothetical protein